MLFFTSDIHFFHKKIIEYCNRPFSSVEEMNETIINNWNATVRPVDDIWVIGDFSFGTPEQGASIFKRLNGNKFLIAGNHDDKRNETRLLPWKMVKEVHDLRYDHKNIFLSHYPHRTWDGAYQGAYHLHGHTHGTVRPWGYSCDVGVDSWGFKPVSFGTLHKFFQTRPKFDPEFQNSFMPPGQLWQGTDFPYSFPQFFVGGESKDNLLYVEAEFKKHKEIWVRETQLLSSGGHDHASYHRIIGLGPAVLPFIFDDLRKELQHWFYALYCITGAEMKYQNPGDMEEIRQIWLNWADLNGYKQETPS